MPRSNSWFWLMWVRGSSPTRSVGGENIFHEVPEQAGLTGGSEFRLYGGHRLWVMAGGRPALISRTILPVAVSQNHNPVRFTAPVENEAPGSNLQKQLEIRLDRAGSRVTVMHRVTNRDSRSTELALWAPTMMKPGGRAILPLPPRAAMDRITFSLLARWHCGHSPILRIRAGFFGTEYIQLQQQTNPAGRFQEQMTGVYNPAGWGAYF